MFRRLRLKEDTDLLPLNITEIARDLTVLTVTVETTVTGITVREDALLIAAHADTDLVPEIDMVDLLATIPIAQDLLLHTAVVLEMDLPRKTDVFMLVT